MKTKEEFFEEISNELDFNIEDYLDVNDFLTSYEDEKHCYCGHEIEQEAEFCSKECAKHYFSEIT